MDFRDLSTVREMFSELTGYAGYEQRLYDAYQRRLAQQRERRTRKSRKKKTPAEVVATQRAWRRANSERINAARRHQRKVANLSAAQLADKSAAYQRWYATQKQHPAKWRKLLDRVYAGQKIRRADQRTSRRAA